MIYRMMFGKQKIYELLLTAESNARQIRSSKNKVIASNSAGISLFGLSENPFAFLKEALQTSAVQKLVDAYCNAVPIDLQIKTPQNVYAISIKKVGHDILLVAEDKTAEFAVHHSLSCQLAFMSDVLSSFSDPLYLTDKAGMLIYVNKAFCDLVGLTVKEILERPLSDFITENCPEFSGMWDSISLVVSQPEPASFHILQRPFETDIDLFFCGTLQKYVPAVLTNEINLFQQSPIPSVIIDVLEHRIIRANPALLTVLKQIEGSLDHMDICSVLSENSAELLTAKLNKMAAGSLKNERFELTTSPDFGSKIFNTFIGWSGAEKDAFILYLIDASERKNLEMQFAHAQKMQAMGQLAGGVAHDFNNLLTAIIGFCDLLLQRHTPTDENFLDLMQIKGNANKASGLVGQLLTFSRKQPSKIRTLSMHDAFVDLSALIQRSLAPFVTLKTEFKRNLGSVKIDPNQLMQIFLNLAVNAKDAMPGGGIFKISATKEKIKKTKACGTDMMPPGDYIKILVSDTGTGIAPEHLPRIFEPFFTTKESANGSGTGLGLSTVYGVIRGADGFISVDSERGVGTTFTIYLPRFEEKPQALSKEAPLIRPVLTPAEAVNILLVDDEDGVRMVAARALKSKGWHVTECGNAEQAIEQLQKDIPIDLMITDMVMPGMDGETLIKQAKQARPKMKVILMSGYSEEFARHGSQKNEAFHFLAKPFELAELLEKVKEVLETD
ncbi:MAG: response regulator [Alphaproteobacteria bacterium]